MVKLSTLTLMFSIAAIALSPAEAAVRRNSTNLDFDACSAGWAYQVTGHPMTEIFSNTLDDHQGNSVSVDIGPGIATPLLVGQMNGSTGSFDLYLPEADLQGMMQVLASRRQYSVTLSFHAGTGGLSTSQVLDNFSAVPTNNGC